jgi:general secretion pathway protein M
MNEWLARLRAALAALSPRERVLVTSVAAIFAVTIFYLGVVSPLLGGIDRARARVATSEQEFAAATQLRSELDEIHGRLHSVEEKIRTGPKGNIFTALETLARESAVKVDSMEPRTAPTGDLYRETKVQVSLKGVTLPQLVNYLHRIESSPQVLSIKSLRLHTRADKPEFLDVTFTVSSFETV